jgi:hypothetical protein
LRFKELRIADFGFRLLKIGTWHNPQSPIFSLTIISDCFHGTTSQGFFTRRLLFFSFRLFINKGITVLVGTSKIFGGRVAANVAVYARRIDIIGAWDILFYAVVAIRQIRMLLKEIVNWQLSVADWVL